jgi:GWxTD domain-containing protein
LRLIVLPALLSLAACASWKRVGETEPNVPAERLPQAFEPRNTFREMGLFTDNGPLGFIGSANVLAGPSPESLLVVVGLSLRNQGLTFRRDGDTFLAEYRVDIALRNGRGIAARAAREERVRVPSFQETQRPDESVIFQQVLTVAPDVYTIDISVRDRNSPNAGHVEAPITVPPRTGPAVSMPVAVYQAQPRTSLDSAPSLVLNPRNAVRYGSDTLRFYIEAYQLAPGASVVLTATDGASHVAWTDTVTVDSTAPVRGFVVSVPPDRLSIGRYDLHLMQAGTVIASEPFVVTFSDQFAVANIEDIISLLRYFPKRDSLRAILQLPPEERSAAWQRFYHASDPNPATPENEAIEDYLRRVQVANERFRDEGIAGWLTDRGEVFIGLGDPSEIIDRRTGDMQGGARYIVWNYYDYRLSLTFIDDTGFGHYRLDPASRSEYQRVTNRLQHP